VSKVVSTGLPRRESGKVETIESRIQKAEQELNEARIALAEYKSKEAG
jgi:hypothetical protein